MSYHEQWRHIAENGVSYYEIWAKNPSHLRKYERYGSYNPKCYECEDEPRNHVIVLLRQLGAGLQFLKNLDTLFPTCTVKQDMFHSWRSSIEESIKNIQPLNALPMSSVDSMQGYVADVVHHKFLHTNISLQRNLMTSSDESSDQPVSARCKCCIHKKMPISLAVRCSPCA